MTKEFAALNSQAFAGHPLKGRFPFRLGTTSCVLPDEILPNVRRLAPRIDDIELVLFESDTFSNMPTATLVAELGAIARDQALTYTVHLPLDVAFGHPDPAMRARSLETCLRLAELMEPLSPFAYIVHFTGDRRGQVPSDDMRRWLDGHRQALTILAKHLRSRRLCVETLEYPFTPLLPVIEEIDLAVCLDIGHLALHDRNVLGHFDRLAKRIRVIHAHGIIDGVDHQSPAACDPTVLAMLIRRLQKPLTGPGCAHSESTEPSPLVFTMEIFSEEDFNDSMQVMRGFLSEQTGRQVFEPAPEEGFTCR